jgi:hypothetical protein
MLGAGHAHAARVKRLLEAARDQAQGQELGAQPIDLEMVLRCPRDQNRSDATNYLGGVADVLESKAHRTGALDHLAELSQVHLYENDRQIEEVNYRWEKAADPSYELRVWTLAG